MATHKTKNADIDKMMEVHLQGYYKALAESKMKKPTTDQKELIDLYEKANLSLMRENTAEDTIRSYAKRFRHFIHLLFADEKLEFENKHKDTDSAEIKFICHRTVDSEESKKRFAVYQISLPSHSQSMEEDMLFQSITIEGNKGMVTRIYRNKIEVSFEDRKECTIFDGMKFNWSDIKFNKRQYISWMRSMYLAESGRIDFALFPDASELMSFVEYNQKLSIFEEEAKLDPQISKFDQRQRQAIFSVVNGLHGKVPFVIWGPPGTGKTVTIVECVRQLLLKDESNRILICTPSNTAADLIARRILSAKALFKNISPDRMRRCYSLGKNVNDRDRALDEITKIEECETYGLTVERFKRDTYEQMKNLRLVFSTLACTSYFEEEIKDDNFFSHIFIDEAGQSLEPETLIPISRYSNKKTRIILCGDHEQLGPVVRANFLKQFKSCQASLMERLMKNYTNGRGVYLDGRTFCQLTDCYRCHPNIIQFSSEHFYKGTLRAVNMVNRSSLCDWKHLPKKGFPIILHVIRKGAEVKQLEGCSFHNRHEIDVVLKYIKLLQDTVWISEDEIGVISPYKQQTQKIRACLWGSQITVDSVESYQGSERRVTILTLTRSEHIGFLSEYKRLNTSLTRAKELLIVVVSLDFVRNLQPYQQNQPNYWIPFIKYCTDNGAVLLDEFAGENGKNEMDSEQMERNVGEFRRYFSHVINKQMIHEERRRKRRWLEDMNPAIIQQEKRAKLSEGERELTSWHTRPRENFVIGGRGYTRWRGGD